ncbi:uncharacterized protein FA14DRAFT_79412 [Meira miltonrushii]|uniref:BZIP domain-containing protein n=1 Tax=Meira miltonrushii TaxID=1280837 RepID=A0A316V611_9BASI|nr:uncharacterized protein FA14DRAFT_79412 [Meira miltonrushii]PWN32912.1 hypothetical protein FA14DRAFT_79412 [Meira miltonrushii]
MFFLQRCFTFCFIVVLVHTVCVSVHASPGKKTASVNALVGVPLPETSRERSKSLSSSSPSSLPERTAAKRPTFDLNRTPSPELEEGAQSPSPQSSRGANSKKNALSVKSMPKKISSQSRSAKHSQRFYWKLKEMTESSDPIEARYATERLAHRRKLNTLSARKRRAAERGKKRMQKDRDQQD